MRIKKADYNVINTEGSIFLSKEMIKGASFCCWFNSSIWSGLRSLQFDCSFFIVPRWLLQLQPSGLGTKEEEGEREVDVQ